MTILPPLIDTHQHCLLSGTAASLRANGVSLPPAVINNIDDITNYAKNIINPLLSDCRVVEKFVMATLLSCVQEHVALVCTSVDYTLASRFSRIDHFLTLLIELRRSVGSHLRVEYDLGISRDNFCEHHAARIYELMLSGVFSGIDLYGNELLANEHRYINLFREARSHDMLRKAHIGEFRRGADIIAVADMLHLNEVQHGINIVDSPLLFAEAQGRGLVFNVCPTSNRILRNISYADHPIKQMLGGGLSVTLGTDDKLIFGCTLNQEYDRLVAAGALSLADAKSIRMFTANYKSLPF